MIVVEESRDKDYQDIAFLKKHVGEMDMSKKSAKPAGPVSRKQQVEALRATKTQEIAASVAAQVSSQMKTMVSEAVEAKFKAVMDTVIDLIDRVVALEAKLGLEDEIDLIDRAELPDECACGLPSCPDCQEEADAECKPS